MRVRKEYKPSGSAGGVPIEPKWPYFKNLLYLAPFLLHRKTKGNLEVDLVPETPIEEASAATEGTEYSETQELTTIAEDNFLESLAVPRKALAGDIFPCQLQSPTTSFEQSRASSPYVESSSFVRIDQSLGSPCPSESSAASSAPKKPKRPRKDTEPDDNQYLMKVLQGTNEFISSVSKKGELDEDDLFGQSIGKELKHLSDYQKSLAKVKIQQVLHEVRWNLEPQ